MQALTFSEGFFLARRKILKTLLTIIAMLCIINFREGVKNNLKKILHIAICETLHNKLRKKAIDEKKTLTQMIEKMIKEMR